MTALTAARPVPAGLQQWWVLTSRLINLLLNFSAITASTPVASATRPMRRMRRCTAILKGSSMSSVENIRQASKAIQAFRPVTSSNKAAMIPYCMRS
jgi:hypothetical protein